MRNSWLGNFGVWLADRFQPRRCTKCEEATTSQYVNLMIDSLKGAIPHYGRDRAADDVPIVADRVDYEKIYSWRTDR
jgi:hypothetical protein